MLLCGGSPRVPLLLPGKLGDLFRPSVSSCCVSSNASRPHLQCQGVLRLSQDVVSRGQMSTGRAMAIFSIQYFLLDVSLPPLCVTFGVMQIPKALYLQAERHLVLNVQTHRVHNGLLARNDPILDAAHLSQVVAFHNNERSDISHPLSWDWDPSGICCRQSLFFPMENICANLHGFTMQATSQGLQCKQYKQTIYEAWKTHVLSLVVDKIPACVLKPHHSLVASVRQV